LTSAEPAKAHFPPAPAVTTSAFMVWPATSRLFSLSQSTTLPGSAVVLTDSMVGAGAGASNDYALFAVPRNTDGVHVTPLDSVDGSGACRLVLDNVVLPDSAWLQGAGRPQGLALPAPSGAALHRDWLAQHGWE
jgi:hypothetical protein